MFLVFCGFYGLAVFYNFYGAANLFEGLAVDWLLERRTPVVAVLSIVAFTVAGFLGLTS